MLQRCDLDFGSIPCADAGLTVSRDNGVACASLHRQQMQSPEWRSWALASWVRGTGQCLVHRHCHGDRAALRTALCASAQQLCLVTWQLCLVHQQLIWARRRQA